MKKISEVFLDYIQPLMPLMLDPKPGTKHYDTVLMIGWTTWNAVVKADINNDPSVINEIKMTVPKQFYKIVNFMVKRKRAKFSEYKYFLGHYEIRNRPSGPSLFVEARESSGARAH